MKRITAVLLCLVLVFSSIAYAEEPSAVDMFNEMLEITEENYRFGITKEELLQSAVNYLLTNNPEMLGTLSKGAYEALDENSYYLTKEEFDTRQESVSMEFSGIGATMQILNGKATITKVHKNTPAIIGGLKTGDVVLKVDGKDISGYVLDDVVNLIRGVSGTPVNLLISRNGQEMNFTLVRNVVNIETVTYDYLEKNNSGYVKIDSFSANTFKEFQQAMVKLSARGVDKIILDLRDNTGGYLLTAVNLANCFVPKGKVLVTEDYTDDEYDFSYVAQGDFDRLKVVVLVNGYSASASEVVTGAIKQHKIGPVVGTTTFGKGTVQTTHTMPNGDGLWLTVAQYNLPNGNNIHGIGIEPDYYVENEEVPVDLSQFPALTKENILQIGDKGPQVSALKQYLEVLGFEFIKEDEVYDDELFEAVKMFQNATGLYPYGVADITTQTKILDMANSATKIVDKQLEKAKELIYEMR